jgi:hypothetical protein
MFRPKKYSPTERQLAALARKAAMNREVLYHGTRHSKSILSMGILFSAERGHQVCFTRSPEEAAYWALLERDHDEGRGSILIFDRHSLQCRYKIEPYHDACWDDETSCRDEAEETIWDDVIDVGKYLIGYVSDPTTQCSDKLKMLNREHRLDMEVRLNELLYHVPDWRHRPEALLDFKEARLNRSILLRLLTTSGDEAGTVADHESCDSENPGR